MSKFARTIMLLWLMFIVIGYTQELPITVEMSVSRQEIRFEDNLTISFTITNLYPLAKQFFIMLPEAERSTYDVIGSDRRRVNLEPKETKQLSFTVNPKIPNDYMVVTIGIGFEGYRIDYATSVKVKILDAKQIRHNMEKKKDDIVPNVEGGKLIQSEGIIKIDSMDAVYPGDDKVLNYPSLTPLNQRDTETNAPFPKENSQKKIRKFYNEIRKIILIKLVLEEKSIL